MKYISKEEIISNIDYSSLINSLEEAFKSEIKVPNRIHFEYENSKEEIDSTLLLMPAWEDSISIGTKILTVSPNNSKYGLPSINGVYLLFDGHKGELQAIIDGKTLTAKRTAAASALASSYLSKKDSKSMLMIGTGALSKELIKAHSKVRDLENIYIWGRTKNKALKIADELSNEFNIKAVDSIEDVISKTDIVSCATLSESPLIFGEYLKEGQHYDLVGSFKPNMREADDSFIKNVHIYIDTKMAKKESGDIKIPLETNIINDSNIKADLFQLTRKSNKGRTSNKEITLFKSVGHGLEDLAAAKLIYKILQKI